eukprot:509339-Prymnesium_polylepis.1
MAVTWPCARSRAALSSSSYRCVTAQHAPSATSLYRLVRRPPRRRDVMWCGRAGCVRLVPVEHDDNEDGSRAWSAREDPRHQRGGAGAARGAGADRGGGRGSAGGDSAIPQDGAATALLA